MPDEAAFSGAVLAGGRSRRMGTDKAFLVRHGMTLLERAAAALADAGARSVLMVGGDTDRAATLGVVGVADGWPGEGPLGGVVTAIEHAAGEPGDRVPDDHVPDDHVIVVLACDVIEPDPRLIRRLVSVRAATDADAAFALADDRPQWLYGVWHPRAGATLRRRFEAGTRSIHGAVDELRLAWVRTDPAAVRDADAPEDLP